VHQRLTYVGNLSNFDKASRKALLIRVESLLLNQFSFPSSDEKIEEEALKIVGKLRSKQSNVSSSNNSGIKEVQAGSIKELSPDFTILLSTLKSERHRSIGAEWLCHQVIGQLGLLDYLKTTLSWSEEQCILFELSLLGRLIHRGSERSTSNWLSETSGSIELQSQKVPLHREALRLSTLDLQAHQNLIESFVYQGINELLKSNPIEEAPTSKQEKIYYDLSNVYFEGRMQQSELAQYGRSKEKRNDQPLVSYGLQTNGLGIIKQSQIYAGNVNESGTFQSQISGVDKGAIVFCDAGIATQENIYYMLQNGHPYMCVAREGFPEFSLDFQGAIELTHHCSNSETYQVWLKSEQHQITIDGQTHTEYLLFVKSEGKRAKEDSMIAKQKQKFIEGLKTIQASLTKQRGHKKITQVHQRIGRLKQKNAKVQRAFNLILTDDGKNITTIKWTYNEQFEQRNGTYIIRTSEPINDLHQTWQTYNGLSTIEEINRSCKTDIKIRPVHHQTDPNIKAHLTLGFLAVNIVRYIRLKLAEKGIKHSWQTILDILHQQHSNIITFSNKKEEWIWVNNWTEPDERMKEIYQALGFKTKAHQGFFFQTSPKSG